MIKNNGDENILVINSNDNIELEFESDLLLYDNNKKEILIKKENRIKIVNISIVFAILFFGEVARGIIIPTINYYSILVGGGATTLGLVISAFSAGRFLATIVLGYFSKFDTYKNIFNVSMVLCIIGSLWYSFSYIDQGNDMIGQSSLVISRFILGFGAGTLSTARSFLADITIPSERTTWIALSSALQFLGFAVSPIIGSLLSYIPPFFIGEIKIDPITSPGWFLTIQNFILFLIIIVYFQNPTLNQLACNNKNIVNSSSDLNKNKNNNKSGSNNNSDNEQDDFDYEINNNNNNNHNHECDQCNINDEFEGSSLKSSDSATLLIQPQQQSIYRILYNNKRIFINLIIFIILNFFIRAILGIYETLGSTLYSKLDTSVDSSTNSGYFFGGMGFLGILLLLVISWLCKKEMLHDYWILCFGNLIITVGCFATMVHQLTWSRFVIGYICIWGIGFTLAQTVVVSMFSKVLSNTIGNASQGTLIGIITASGSLGRVIGPLFSGLLYDENNLLPLFSFAFALSLILLFSSILMIPKDILKIKYLNHNDNNNNNNNNNNNGEYNEENYNLIK
ncbi:hypothetical protein RB653_001615 [Dictyostelium firmibasis]|uniref:Major facilitator superfamily (MFS) profile domain-containing protein n=1 Tax=Dictyostelium firmibasis TaxID=79012 RepID=A0AAN7U7K9_9MYCE